MDSVELDIDKSPKIYYSIGEVASMLSVNTSLVRFWEKEFKQIKPKILNGNRRYFDNKSIDLLKKIKFLLKDQGMTINGVKKILNSKESLPLDELANNSIKAERLKQKLVKISGLIKSIKNIK